MVVHLFQGPSVDGKWSSNPVQQLGATEPDISANETSASLVLPEDDDEEAQAADDSIYGLIMCFTSSK
jgi:hypothetical protein